MRRVRKHETRPGVPQLFPRPWTTVAIVTTGLALFLVAAASCASHAAERSESSSASASSMSAPPPAPADSASPGDSIDAAMAHRVDVHFTPLPDTMLVRMLRQGGLVLAFRHANTDMSQQDSDVSNLANRSTQRNLTDAGRANATNIGRTIAALGIPIGAVRASPFWRCRDTATLAFGRCDTTLALYAKGPAYRRARWILLTTPPRAGTNDVLVTHQDVLMPLTTLKRDELREADALIEEPRGPGRGFHVLARVGPEDWRRLAAAVGVTVPGLVPVPQEPATPGSVSPKR